MEKLTNIDNYLNRDFAKLCYKRLNDYESIMKHSICYKDYLLLKIYLMEFIYKIRDYSIRYKIDKDVTMKETNYKPNRIDEDVKMYLKLYMCVCSINKKYGGEKMNDLGQEVFHNFILNYVMLIFAGLEQDLYEIYQTKIQQRNVN